MPRYAVGSGCVRWSPATLLAATLTGVVTARPPAVDSFYAHIPKGRVVGVELGAPIACGQQYMVRCVPAS